MTTANLLLRTALCLVFVICVAAGAAAATSVADRLMPQVAKITPGEGRLAINGDFRVSLTGYREARLQAAADRLVMRLARQTGIPINPLVAPASQQGGLQIECKGASAPVQKVGEDESYRLQVTTGSARLSAATPLGVLRGIETFLQLVQLDGDGFVVPAVTIDDQPRFPWRGLLLDVGRHFMPVGVVKRTLDGMAAVKLNTLHLHISDDQGFRVESKTYPKLHQLGSDGQYYTHDQIRDIIAYARERGIRVLPEFDMPGHTTSWFVGYPELHTTSAPTKIEDRWGIMDPAMDPTRDGLYKFLDGFIGEMAALFPDEYFHIGGDEVNGKEWKASAAVQAFNQAHGLKDNHDLQAWFNKKLQAIVAKHGKKMMGWDEILHPDLPKDIMVQSWRGQKSLAQSARQGYQGILSFGYYLDLMFPASQHYMVDPMGGDAANLTPEEQSRILGGEACQWAEFISPENVDSRVFPRVAVIAERLWSPQNVRDIPSMYARMAMVSRHLEWAGMKHRANQDMMYKRLAGAASPGPVRVLGEIVEPVKEYERGSIGDYTRHTPLNRLIDAIWPESWAGREFTALAQQAVSPDAGSAAARVRLRRQLDVWQQNDARLKPIMESSPLMREHAALSQTVAKVAASGLEALAFLEKGERPSAEWSAQQKTLLDAAAKRQGELLVMIVPGVRALVQAAAK